MIEQQSAKIASVDYLLGLLEYAEEKGVEGMQLLEASGIDQKLLSQENAYMSTKQYLCLIEHAIKLLNEPALALSLGQRQHLSSHGPLGYAVISSSNVEQALQMVRRFIHTRNRLVRVHFFVEGEQAVTQIEVKHQQDELYKHCVETAFSSMMTICNSLAEKPPSNWQLKLAYKKPAYHELYQSMFHTTPEFDAGVNEIRLPISWFENVNLMSNPAFAQLAQQQCEEILAQLDAQSSLEDHVLALLSRSPGYMPNQEDIAKQLGLSTRSLSRKLAQEGTTFKNIVNQTRQQTAIELLQGNEHSIEDIAYHLGYESPPNFSRAFKRWTGKTPQQYRLQK